MPAKRRRLEDLYVIGKDVVFDDGHGDEVAVWLQKLNPVEMSNALRRANAARARVRSVRSDKDADEYMDLWLQVLEWDSHDALVDYLAAETVLRIQDRIEAELAAEEEWSKDNYLEGLRDGWEGGLEQEYFLNPDNAEARRVRAELERFAQEAVRRGEGETAAARREIGDQPVNILQEKAMDRIINYRSSAAWLEEFHRSELLYGVRPPDDHRAYYFTDATELDRLSGEVLARLYDEYAELSVDVVEGKGSQETPTSSDSSEPPSEVETGVSSGLVDASR